MFNEIPPSVYVAVGAFTAALIGGLCSYLNMISSKENKVSEFRHEWVNELRNEISKFTASAQIFAEDIDFYNENPVIDESFRLD